MTFFMYTLLYADQAPTNLAIVRNYCVLHGGAVGLGVVFTIAGVALVRGAVTRDRKVIRVVCAGGDYCNSCVTSYRGAYSGTSHRSGQWLSVWLVVGFGYFLGRPWHWECDYHSARQSIRSTIGVGAHNTQRTEKHHRVFASAKSITVFLSLLASGYAG